MTAKDKRREANIIATTACTVCASPIGQRCREGVHAHDSNRGVEDLRPFLGRVHTERRTAWVTTKQGTQDMENSTSLTIQSSDIELMEKFESLRRQACGEAIGVDGQTPEEAAILEGWTLHRFVLQGTNCPGTPVLAEDIAGNLWIVNDLDGPWAIQVSEAA